VVAVDLDGLLRRAHGDDAVIATLKVHLQIGYQACGHLIIEKITELRQKL
jgi:hypothetical protein